MITKCKRIKNVGKFYDFSSQANALDWHKNTFLFAPNAYGKSTLVNVLRSLRENDPKLIRGRKTLGTDAAPEAVIVIDGANHFFNGTRWDRPFPNIQIFDAPFIHANILAHEIEYEHRKNSYKIIVGDQGVKLAQELAGLKDREKARHKQFEDLDAKFRAADFTHTLDAFLSIPTAEGTAVAGRIQKLEQDIKSKESEAVVRALTYPSTVTTVDYEPVKLESKDSETPSKGEQPKEVDHFAGLRALAYKKLTTLHKVAAKQVLDHIERNFKDKTQAKQFIRQGLDLIKADCPFCGQELKNAADLLNAYQGFFDEAFRAYQQSVVEQVALFEKWNLDNDLTALVSTHNANLATVRQWEPYLGLVQLPDLSATVDGCRAGLVASKGKVLFEMERKQKDPNADSDLTHFDTFAEELTALKTAVAAYNSAIAAFTKKAKQYVVNLPKSNVASIRAAIAKEEEIKKRFAPEWKKWATDYPTVKKEADDLLTKKNAKQADLAAYTKTIFETCQTRINELLLSLGADFAVTELTGKTDERANESYSDFGFLILEKKVPISARQDDAPCFRNTLSEGDKSTLAFAFFIAALEKTPELDKQIVVFDDPLSSLDENRRWGTVGMLASLSRQVNQLCVFTHKIDFLRMLFDGIPDNSVLQLKSDKKKGSWVEPFDVDDDRKAEIARLCDTLSHYLDEDFGPTPEDMQGNIRKVFEIILKTKYYPALAAEIKRKSGLGDLILALHGKGLISDTVKDQLFRLCRLSDVAHHGALTKLPEHVLTREEIRSAIQETFSVAEKV